MRQLRYPIALSFMMVLLAACNSLGLATPQTFNQRVAVAIGVHTAVLQATTTAVSSGKLSSSDGQAVLTQADNARALIDAAVAASAAGDATGATNKLALASAALTALQTYLNAHGSP